MSLFEVGRLCIKVAGRDAGNKCVVIQELDKGYVLIDGGVRRKKVNIKHLEPLAEIIELNNKASHEEVKKVFEKSGWEVWDKKSKTVPERPKKHKKKKEKLVKEVKKEKVKAEEKKGKETEKTNEEIVKV